MSEEYPTGLWRHRLGGSREAPVLVLQVQVKTLETGRYSAYSECKVTWRDALVTDLAFPKNPDNTNPKIID